ncbi:alpha/beta fold hydrolase [Saccharothrix isguenensis]
MASDSRRMRTPPSSTEGVFVQADGEIAATGCCLVSRVTTEDNATLHLKVRANNADRPTVLFVNGLNTTMVYWSRQHDTLADLATLVFFDHRGHGGSTDCDVAHATVAAIGRDVGAVIDAVAPGGRVIVVAHSMGGMALYALAAQRPNLFGDKVIGVALLDTVPAKWNVIAMRLPQTLADAIARGLWLAVPPLRRLVTDMSERRHAVPHQRRQTRRKRPGPARMVRRLVTSTRTMTLLALLADASTCDHTAGAAALGAADVLVIAGDDDHFVPLRHKRKAAGLIPGARFVVVPGAGHLSSIRKPDEVDRLLREFISEH